MNRWTMARRGEGRAVESKETGGVSVCPVEKAEMRGVCMECVWEDAHNKQVTKCYFEAKESSR